jgi:hypothetical protein
VYLDNWQAWDSARGQLLARDARHFHTFAEGQHRGAFGRYYSARAALTGNGAKDYGLIAKWMDTAFDYFDRALLDLYWQTTPSEAEATESPDSAARDYLLIERLNYDYPPEWADRYAVVADGAIQGAYTTMREAHSRVESLQEGNEDSSPSGQAVFIVSVGPPREESGWYVKVVEAFYPRTG